MGTQFDSWEKIESDFRNLQNPKLGLHAFGNMGDPKNFERSKWAVLSHGLESGDYAKVSRYRALCECLIERGWAVSGSPKFDSSATDPLFGSPLMNWWLDTLEKDSWHLKHFESRNAANNWQPEKTPVFKDICMASIEYCELMKHRQKLDPSKKAKDLGSPSSFPGRAAWLKKTLGSMTPASFAERHGKPDAKTLRNILQGQRVTETTLEKLAGALNISTDEIPNS